MFYCSAYIGDHVDRRGDIAWALARWHLMASHEATDVLHRHQAMRIAPYRPDGTVIEIVADQAKCLYIVDYKIINSFFMFTIYLNRFYHTLTQPLVLVSLALDWVRLTNSHR